MAQIPSFYYGDYSEPQQAMSGTYSIYPDPFMGPYTSNSSPNLQPSTYQPNNYQTGFTHSSISQPPYEGQNYFCGQQPPASPSVNATSSHHDAFFRNDMTSSLRSNQPANVKTANNFENRCPSEELDEPLNELPLESLLQITHHEGQLINESQVEDRRIATGQQMCIPMAQGEEPASSRYSSSTKSFYPETDHDDDDSGSCISSSTMYSLNSTPDSVVPTHSLNQNYDQLSNPATTPNSVSTCAGSPYEPSSFDDPLHPSHPYTLHTNLDSGTTFPNMNGTAANNNFLASSSQATPPPGQMVDYPPVSPSYRQNMPNVDVGSNFEGLYSSQHGVQDLKNTETRHVKKKTRLTKLGSKSDQNGSKRSKKHKVKDISTNAEHGNPFSNDVGSADDDSLAVLEELDRRISRVAEEDDDSSESSTTEFPSGKNVFVPPVHSVQDHKKTNPPRKRMRCPRGMALEIKPCKVCGDNAKNMHFGGLVCDSCKAFFRRSVQSNTCDQFKCEKEENCIITKTNRRGCQYCRFHKCVAIGMQMEWVMTESGRMSLLKNRLARTRQVQEDKENDVVYGDLPRGLDREDAVAINRILNTLHTTFGSMPYPKQCVGNSIDTLSNVFVFLCKRFGKFFLKITDETDLCQEDKTLLLRNGIGMSLYINGAHMYDAENRSWPASSTNEAVKVPHLTLETLEKLASIPDAFSTIMKFYGNYESDLKDHVVAALMYLISFFQSEDTNFLDILSIQKVQEEYIGYLKRYLIARDGYRSVTGIFLKLMDGLTYVKDILKYHALVDIKPTIDHTDLSLYAKTSISQSMTNLIHQMEMSLKGNFPPYASVLNEDEKESTGLFKNRSSLSRSVKRREGDALMLNHPDTIAIFGSTTRTDMLITQPLQNMIEWQERNDHPIAYSPSEEKASIPRDDGANDGTPSTVLSPSNNHHHRTNGEKDDDNMVVSQEVDVDAVCDILKQLSHTDDVKVFSIFKENIPRELLVKFSRTLSEDEP